MIEFAHPGAAILVVLPWLLRWLLPVQNRQSGALALPSAFERSFQPARLGPRCHAIARPVRLHGTRGL